MRFASLRVHTLLVVYALVLSSQVPSSEAFAQPRPVEGVLSVKLSPAAAAALASFRSDDPTATGLAALDGLNRQLGVVRMQRLFRPAGRHEARHIAWGLDRWYRIELSPGADAQAAVPAFDRLPEVELAERTYEKQLWGEFVRLARPDEVYESARARADDPRYGEQWHYHNTGQTGGREDADIDLPEAHDVQTGSADVVVVVHDTGVDLDHPDLAAALWVNPGEVAGNDVDDDDNGYVDDVHGYDFADDTGDVSDSNGHGTHTAGTIGAVSNNGVGVAGVAGGDGTAGSGVRLMIAQVFGRMYYSGGFAESYVYAADNGAVISSNSWGYTYPGYYEQAELDAIDYFIANAGSDPGAPLQGGLVVFSAGNADSDGAYYPGYYAPTVAVASTGHTDVRAYYSNYGDWVDLAAPGGDTWSGGTVGGVLSTYPNDSYAFLQGTSMAAPHVSGVAALMASAVPGAPNDVLREVLEQAVDSIAALNPGYALGSGRLNAYLALDQLEDDDVAPAAVADLAATGAGNRLTLTWTAPGDDADAGTARRYDVRYATTPIDDEADFDAAARVHNVAAPQPAGSAETAAIAGLAFNTRYYVALRTADNLGNWSDLSNVADAVTDDPPDVAVAPAELAVSFKAGASALETVTVSNEGTGTLYFSVDGYAARAVLAQAGAAHNDTTRIYDAAPAEGTPDTREGHPVVLGAGGPDAFGYTWIDSRERGGPRFDWQDISTVGTLIQPGYYNAIEVALPFTFPFYGKERTKVWVSAFGVLALGNPNNLSSLYYNEEIPSAYEPNELIAPFWDELEYWNTKVYTYFDAAKNRFVVQYDSVRHRYEQGAYTFQVILSPKGRILFQYLDVENGGPLNSATIGIEDRTGREGLQVAFNTAFVEDSLAILLAVTPDLIRDVQPVSGTLDPGASQVLTASFGAEDTTVPDDYTASFFLATNDLDEPEVEVAAAVTLLPPPPPEIEVAPSEINVSMLPNQEAVRTVTIANTGEGNLRWRAAMEASAPPSTPRPCARPCANARRKHRSAHPRIRRPWQRPNRAPSTPATAASSPSRGRTTGACSSTRTPSSKRRWTAWASATPTSAA